MRIVTAIVSYSYDLEVPDEATDEEIRDLIFMDCPYTPYSIEYEE